MTRHVIDTPKARSDDARLAAYLRQDRAQTPNPASLALQRRARTTAEGNRAKAYTRIDRGREA